MTRDAGIRASRARLDGLGRWLDRTAIWIPLLFLLLMVGLAPLSYSAEFDTDEGVNLMKALLVSRGHPLYTEIWSDQPPVLTVLLAETIQVFGASTIAARALVLCFSALLVWSFFQAVRLSTSRFAALLGLLLLLISAWYVRLSIAVMVGLPALALAMLAAYLFLVSYARGRLIYLAASGVTLALAMQTKLLAGMLAPVMAGYVLLVSDDEGQQTGWMRRRAAILVIWSVPLLGCFVGVGWIFGAFDVNQLLQSHLGSATRAAFAADNLHAVGDLLLREIGVLPFALLGIVWALRRHEKMVWLPLAWSLAALAFLLYEQPLWYHHVTAMTVPLTWLASLGLEAWIGWLRQSAPRREAHGSFGWSGLAEYLRPASIAFVGLACFYLVLFTPFTSRVRIRDEMYALIPPYSREVADYVRQGYAGQPIWVFTDRPMYAFRAALPVPPPIAALTVKRMRAGGPSDEEMAGMLESYRPEVVILDRFRADYGPLFRAVLADQYEPISVTGTTEVWAPALPAALHAVSAAEGFRQHEFDGWLTLAVPEAALPVRLNAGDELLLRDLWWLREGGRPGQPLSVSLRLVDQDGWVWSQRDTPIGTDLADLVSGPHVMQSLSLPVPPDAPVGEYLVRAVVYDPQSGRPLLASAGPDGQQSSAVLGSVEVHKSPEDGIGSSSSRALRRTLADFGPLRLLRAETPASIVSPGDVVPVSLTWEVGNSSAIEPLVVVIQLLDDRDRVVAGLEEQPLAGRYPTTVWQPGELVGDHHILAVPSDTAPGHYRLVVGLYSASDRVRLAARTGLLGLLTRPYFTAGAVDVR